MLESLLKWLTDFVLDAGVKILISLIILVVGFKLVKWVINRMKKSRLFGRIDPSAAGFVLNFCAVGLKILLIIIVASYLGVATASLVAVLGSAGVAIGLALQGGLSNIASGMMLVFLRPFSVGDYVENGSYSGTVVSISLFHTTLNTPDNVHVVIPNSQLTSQTVVNYSAEQSRRVDLDFSVSYDADTDEVKAALLECAAETEGVLADPAADAVMLSHGDSAVVFRLRAWCPTAKYWDVRFMLLESVKKKLDDRGISIPYPQMDVHVKSINKE